MNSHLSLKHYALVQGVNNSPPGTVSDTDISDSTPKKKVQKPKVTGSSSSTPSITKYMHSSETVYPRSHVYTQHYDRLLA